MRAVYIRLVVALSVATAVPTQFAATSKTGLQSESAQHPASQSTASPPISIPNVDSAENNIQAGAKSLYNIAATYFKDDKLDPTNKTLMVFASCNAGPTRIVRLRKKAASEGLDPNQWFGNVELVVAKNVGQETVQYVSNIYKYYVACKLTLQEAKVQNEPGSR
jgi:membrane-bound lytic murein transglycosylase MltF